MPRLIHIHGFLSSSHIARDASLWRYIEEASLGIELVSPVLPDKPQAAMALLNELIRESKHHKQPLALLGHSLGGYYATYLAYRYQLPAVLLNPVVRGYEIMCNFFGDCYNPHTDTSFRIEEEDIGFLASLLVEPQAIQQMASQLMVIQQLGDEIINPRDVLTFYRNCLVVIEQGGNHSFLGVDRHLDNIMAFLLDNAICPAGQPENNNE